MTTADEHPQHPGVEVDGDVVTVRDPRAIRALAHEARQQVLWALYEGESLTATAAAERVGLTPSAMSYHLRALEKWGLVRRGESTDGRERPWEAVGRTLNVHGHGVAALDDPAQVAYLAPTVRRLTDAVQRVAQGPSGSRVSTVVTWITDEENEALYRDLDAVLARHEGRSAADHPDGARRTEIHLVGLREPRPADDSPDGAASPA